MVRVIILLLSARSLILPLLGFDAARAAELVAVLALQDWLSGNTTNKAAVQKSLDIYETQKPEYPNSSGVEVRLLVPIHDSAMLTWNLVVEFGYPILGSRSILCTPGVFQR